MTVWSGIGLLIFHLESGFWRKLVDFEYHILNIKFITFLYIYLGMAAVERSNLLPIRFYGQNYFAWQFQFCMFVKGKKM